MSIYFHFKWWTNHLNWPEIHQIKYYGFNSINLLYWLFIQMQMQTDYYNKTKGSRIQVEKSYRINFFGIYWSAVYRVELLFLLVGKSMSFLSSEWRKANPREASFLFRSSIYLFSLKSISATSSLKHFLYSFHDHQQRQ